MDCSWIGGDSFGGIFMLAILGLIGVAISALVIIDVDSDEDDLKAEEDGTLSTNSGPLPIVPVSEIAYADDFDESPAVNIADEGGAPIFAGNGDDTVAGGASDDYVNGEDGNDTLSGGGGDDTLHGGNDDDVVTGGEGNDLLLGNVGDDTLDGDAGDDTLQGGMGDDHLDGGSGDDAMQGYLGNDTMISGDGSDVMYGGAGDDLLDGRDDGATDYLNGNAGNDRLVSGAGDHLNGGKGEDVFAMNAGASGFIDDFSNADDMIEVLYEGDEPPMLTTESTDDGLALLADGQVVAVLGGLETLDLERVSLVAA